MVMFVKAASVLGSLLVMIALVIALLKGPSSALSDFWLWRSRYSSCWYLSPSLPQWHL